MKIINIKKTYNEKVVLDVNELNIKEGEITALIGPNGSGKSTLAKCLSGVIKNSCKWEQKVNVTYMPQKIYAFKLSVLNNVLLTSKDKKKDLKRARELISELKIEEIEKQKASSLSGGEAQKMALARILLNPSALVILDEPTSQMDIASIKNSEKIITKINKEFGITFLLITHSIPQAKRIAKNVVFLDKGLIKEEGKTSQILSSPKTDSLKEFLNFEG